MIQVSHMVFSSCLSYMASDIITGDSSDTLAETFGRDLRGVTDRRGDGEDLNMTTNMTLLVVMSYK